MLAPLLAVMSCEHFFPNGFFVIFKVVLTGNKFIIHMIRYLQNFSIERWYPLAWFFSNIEARGDAFRSALKDLLAALFYRAGSYSKYFKENLYAQKYINSTLLTGKERGAISLMSRQGPGLEYGILMLGSSCPSVQVLTCEERLVNDRQLFGNLDWHEKTRKSLM